MNNGVSERTEDRLVYSIRHQDGRPIIVLVEPVMKEGRFGLGHLRHRGPSPESPRPDYPVYPEKPPLRLETGAATGRRKALFAARIQRGMGSTDSRAVAG